MMGQEPDCVSERQRSRSIVLCSSASYRSVVDRSEEKFLREEAHYLDTVVSRLEVWTVWAAAKVSLVRARRV